jgi:hypothetical protein
MKYYQPNVIEEFKIYDVLHNDNNKLIIITPYLPTHPTIKYISYDNTVFTFDLHKCPHNHTFIYSLHINYDENIKIMIGDCIIKTFVNKYPSFKDEILFSTLVKDEDAFILPWIHFHLRLGVSRFIIYDNSTRFTLSTLLNEYIQKNIVLLIKWPHPYLTTVGCQQTQQNHSIYAFQNSKYIGLFDIDEYVNIQGMSNINRFFEKVIIEEGVNINEISCFRLLNKFFYNPNHLPVVNNQFLNIFNCDTITTSGHEKCFVLPKKVVTFSVHMVTSGKPMHTINEKKAYFNHYYFLNKNERGRNKTSLIDYTILEHLHDLNHKPFKPPCSQMLKTFGYFLLLIYLFFFVFHL